MSIRTRLTRAIVSSTMLLLASGAIAEIPGYDRVRILQSPVAIGDAELTDQYGEPFRLSELNGRVALVFFGFTNCPDVCPLTMQSFRQFRNADGVDVENIAFVLISVDGERDTPEVMKAYLEQFAPGFIGLTAAPSTVKSLAGQFSAAFYKRTTDAHGGYMIGHSPQSFVLDPKGRLRAEFYTPTIEAMSAVTQALLLEDQ